MKIDLEKYFLLYVVGLHIFNMCLKKNQKKVDSQMWRTKLQWLVAGGVFLGMGLQTIGYKAEGCFA